MLYKISLSQDILSHTNAAILVEDTRPQTLEKVEYR